MAGKIKADPKQFLINHGEKIGFAVVLVLVVLGLAGTDWVPYERAPEEITEKVETAEQALASGNWQQDAQLADEREKYRLDEEERPQNVVLASLSGEIEVSPYRASQRLSKSIVEVDRPITEPNFLPVENLVASNVRVYLELPPELESTDEDTDEGDEATEPAEDAIADEDLPDELRQRRGVAGSAMSGYDGFDNYDDTPDYSSMEAPELDLEAMYGAAGADPSMYGAGYEGYDGYSEGGAMSNRRGRGYSFVSVRGVYPFKNQIHEYRDATHQSLANAVRSFQIIDFQLQRQEKPVGDASPWPDFKEENEPGFEEELVDITVLRDVIDSASGIEPDVVKTAVTDAVITCPLPTRLTGIWDRQATHPRLQNFVLSEAELEREMQFNRALLKEVMDKEKQLPLTGITPRGFSDMIFDSRTLQQTLMDADSAYDSGMMTGMYDDEDYAGMMGGYGGGYGYGGQARQSMSTEASPELTRFAQDLAKQFNTEELDLAAKELEAWIVERASAEGELLLYRYLDFDVKPGYSYRYRVRLELKNPNYLKPITAAGGVEHVVQGETRFTDWSEPTEPEQVDETVQYFLAGVEPNRVNQFPDAQMKVFQWDTEFGTIVHDELTVEMGQEIGGTEKVEQINAAKQTYEEDNYEFDSDDRLVDAIEDLEFERGEHPDLALPQGSLRAGQIVEYALVVQDERALVALDPRSQAKDLRRQEMFIEKQEELYSAYRNQGPGGAMDPNSEQYDLIQQLYGAGAYEGSMPEGYDGYGSGGRRGRSALRRGR